MVPHYFFVYLWYVDLKDFAKIGIATGVGGGIEFNNPTDSLSDNPVKYERRKVDWGGVALYGLTALCFMAIGALIGLWTLVI